MSAHRALALGAAAAGHLLIQHTSNSPAAVNDGKLSLRNTAKGKSPRLSGPSTAVNSSPRALIDISSKSCAVSQPKAVTAIAGPGTENAVRQRSAQLGLIMKAAKHFVADANHRALLECASVANMQLNYTKPKDATLLGKGSFASVFDVKSGNAHYKQKHLCVKLCIGSEAVARAEFDHMRFAHRLYERGLVEVRVPAAYAFHPVQDPLCGGVVQAILMEQIMEAEVGRHRPCQDMRLLSYRVLTSYLAAGVNIPSLLKTFKSARNFRKNFVARSKSIFNTV